MRQAARAYFETQITTTSKGQLLLMLYDGAIKFLTRAKDLIDAKDVAGKGKLISSAIDVINELASSLNAEKGGDLAANLSQLYFYCNKRLFMANSRMDKAAIDEVIKILGGLRSAYAQIIDTPEAQKAMAEQVVVPLHNAMRSPVGVASPPAGAPIPKAKAHNAYATQGVAIKPHTQSESDMPAPKNLETSAPAVPLKEVEALPVAEPAAQPPAPDMPEGLPNSFALSKKLSASNSYRKFAP